MSSLEPTFQRMSSGKLSLSDSAAARAWKEEHRERNRTESQSVVQVKTWAQQAVKSKGGDESNAKHLLGQYTIQFGQYRYMKYSVIFCEICMHVIV